MKEVIIETKSLCKSFDTDGQNYNVIKNMDLKIYKGDFTVIMGSSGSGKSTLMYLLSGMDNATMGEVKMLDKDFRNMGKKEMDKIRREKLSFVFQGINLINDLNIYENIAAPTYKMNRGKKELRETIDELLNTFGLKEHESKYPSQLSGGQKQRVAICRALINKPEVIFADEPTGALNSSSGQEVLDILSKLNNEGQSIVMVTHDAKAACRANRLLYIKDGRIDGELNMPSYTSMEQEERKEEVFSFLESKNW